MNTLLPACFAAASLALAGAAHAQTERPEPVPAEEDARATVPPKEAAENAEAMAASPAERIATTPVSATVCEPRVTSVHFGRASTLSRENRSAIEHALDAASACTLHSLVIADSGVGRASARRAEAVRTALVRRGVPRERISIESAALSEGQLDVRMNLADPASADAPTEEAEPAPPPF